MVLSRLLCLGLGAPALQCHYGFGFELSSGGPGFGTVSVHIEYLTVMGLQTVTRSSQRFTELLASVPAAVRRCLLLWTGFEV